MWLTYIRDMLTLYTLLQTLCIFWCCRVLYGLFLKGELASMWQRKEKGWEKLEGFCQSLWEILSHYGHKHTSLWKQWNRKDGGDGKGQERWHLRMMDGMMVKQRDAERYFKGFYPDPINQQCGCRQSKEMTLVLVFHCLSRQIQRLTVNQCQRPLNNM